MEVRGQNGNFGKPALERFHDLREALTRRDAAKVRQARDTLNELSETRQEIQRAARQDAARRAALESRRESAEATSPTASRPRGDSIEISDEARAAADVAAQAGEAPDRQEKIAALRAEHDAGSLNTPERVERAAQRLLGAD